MAPRSARERLTPQVEGPVDLDGIDEVLEGALRAFAADRVRDQTAGPLGKAGAAGFLLKTAPPARLVDAIRVVNTGEALLAPSVTRRLIEAYVQRPAPGSTHAILNQLTAREQDVLKLIASGLSNNEIAEHLVLSQATVKTHINRLFAKLGVRDRVQAVVLAYQSGLVPSDTVTR